MYRFVNGVNFCWNVILLDYKKIVKFKKKIVVCYIVVEIIFYCVFFKEYNGM